MQVAYQQVAVSTTSCRPRARGCSAGAARSGRSPRSFAADRRETVITDGPFAESQGAARRLLDHHAARPRRRARVGGEGLRPRACARSRCARSKTKPRGLNVAGGRDQRRRAELARVFREESGRAVAVLVRLFGDIDIAEEMVQEAFVERERALAGNGTAPQPRRLDHRRPRSTERSTAASRVIAQGSPRARPAPPPRTRRRTAEGTPCSDERLAAHLHLLPPGAGREAQVALTLRSSAGSTPTRSRARSSFPSRRWPSGSCAPSRRSATRASRTACPTTTELPDRARRRDRRDLPRLQRGLHRDHGRRAGRAPSSAPRRSGSRGLLVELHAGRARGRSGSWR